MGNSATPGIIIFVCGIMGFLLAVIEQVAFDNEWIFHLYMEAEDLPGLQIITIVIWLIIGGVLAALTQK